MEIICLDTNVLIAHKRAKKFERAKKFDKDQTFLFKLSRKFDSFAVSCMTVYELLRGDNQDEDIYWKAMFSNMLVITFDMNCADHAAKIYQNLKKRGLLIETEDLLIAATALSHQMRLATTNVKHFARIEELKLITPDKIQV
ncbi:MAG: type II toxin-antitoxin system VapC family toxin [Thiotrichaceae bacterium]